MRVLFITQYFPPETGGPQNRLASLAKGFADEGHDVHVITQKPNYPTGIVWQEYRGGLFRKEEIGQATVTQCAVWEDHKKTFFTRVRSYLTFVLMSTLAGLRSKGSYDVVIASSPPLFVGISGWLVSKIKRAHFIFDVRDLWPDVAIAMGELNSKRAAGIAKSLEKFIYRNAAGVTAVTESFCNDIQQTSGGNVPVRRVTNGTVPETFNVETPMEVLRNTFEMGPQKYIGFIGNLGLAQGLDHIVEAAAKLKAQDVRFLFVGDGARKEALSSLAEELGAKNVEFRSRVDLPTASKYMAACDALIVSLGSNDIYSKFIPSKLFDTMAAAKPMLLNVDGESRKIMEEARGGVYYKPEDSTALVNAISELFSAQHDLASMGRSAREYVTANFTRESQARIMCKFAAELVSGKKINTFPNTEQINDLAA